MKPINTQWMIQSETGLPAWLVLLGFTVVLWLMLRWLRNERGTRTGIAVRLLPYTLLAILVAAALITWRPVPTRIQTWSHTAETVLVIDESNSMKTPIRCERMSDKLSLVAAWDATLCSGRSLAAKSFRDKLGELLRESTTLAGELENAVAEADQGLPPGPPSLAASQHYASLQPRLRSGFTAPEAEVQPLLEGERAIGTPEARRDGLESIAQLEKTLASLPPPSTAPSEENLRTLIRPLSDFREAAAALAKNLDDLQENADRAFYDAHKDQLEKAVEAVGRRSRAELASLVLRNLPEGLAPAKSAATADMTDLYAKIAETMGASKDHVISHCVLVSDGAHNGADDQGVMARLKKQGVQFVAVGAGLAGEPRRDLAITDWKLPRVLKAGKPASLSVDIKAPAGAAFKLILMNADKTLATGDFTAGQTAATTARLAFTAPPEGRHVLTLKLESPSDVNPVNNIVLLQTDCLSREQRLLLIGTVPNWDDAWLSLASERQGYMLSQLYTAGDEPKRGSLSRAIPSSLAQWSRYRAIILDGPVFKGFSDTDAADLHRFVTENGGTLLIFNDDTTGFIPALAKKFGWNSSALQEVSGSLRLAPAAFGLPCVRLDLDGPQSSRRLEELPLPARMSTVPAQDIPLIQNASGEAVCSLGFYGRGKVILWGMNGMYKMREYEHAAIVDRLLDAVINELAAPLFDPAAADLPAVYPPLPQTGKACRIFLPVAENAAVPELKASGKTIAATSNADGQARFIFTPSLPAETLDAGGKTLTLNSHNNPGAEEIDSDFNEKFLQGMAQSAGGEYAPALGAGPLLAALKPKTYTTRTADSWPVGRSPFLIACLILAATAHWILRKAAGFPI